MHPMSNVRCHEHDELFVPLERTKEIGMNTEAIEMIRTIERAFVAIVGNDYSGVDESFTPDFHAFEDGVHMTRSQLIEVMRKHYVEGTTYRWSVNSPRTEVQGDLGVLVYINRRSIAKTADAEPSPMAWLETAVLRRANSLWRLAFLHSTRAKEPSGT